MRVFIYFNVIAECISKIKHRASIAIKSNKKTQVIVIYVCFFAFFCICLAVGEGLLAGRWYPYGFDNVIFDLSDFHLMLMDF